MSSFSIVLWSAAVALMITGGLATLRRPLTTHKVTTCGSSSNVHRLSCDYGVISVVAGMYGRLDRETCSSGWISSHSNINCARSTTYTIRRKCNGKKFCETNVRLLSSYDPCRGTYKYLETTYACVAPPIRVVACGGSTAHLRCDQGQVIMIVAANYGRWNRATCCYGRPYYQLSNVRCTSSVTRTKVQRMCNMRSSCSVKASSTLFGDPCLGTYKYLQVDYRCIIPYL